MNFFNEDCISGMKNFEDKSFDLAICDPPYGIKRFEKPQSNGKFRCSEEMQKGCLLWDKKPTQEYFNEVFRVSKYQIIFGANNFTLPPSEYFLIWNKEQTVPNFSSAEYAWTNVKIPAKVFTYSIHKHNSVKRIHPTQKPIDLYRWILRTYAKEGYKIFDPNVGSGSSIIACYEEGFDFTGFELNEKHFKDAQDRFNVYISQKKLFQL